MGQYPGGCPCGPLTSAVSDFKVHFRRLWQAHRRALNIAGSKLLRAVHYLWFCLEVWQSDEFLGLLPDLWSPVLWERPTSPCLFNIRISGPSYSSLPQAITVRMKGLGLFGMPFIVTSMTTECFLAIVQPQLSWRGSLFPYWKDC